RGLVTLQPIFSLLPEASSFQLPASSTRWQELAAGSWQLVATSRSGTEGGARAEMSIRRHMSTTRQYELVYIVTPEASEQETTDLHTQIEQIVQRFSGTLDKTENWGRKRLAYDIGHHREGTYVVETITGSGELMKEIDRRLRVIDQVIRHLVVRVDEELRVAQRTGEARKKFTARRRVARGLPPERQPGEGRGGADSQDAMECSEVQRWGE